MEPMFGKLYRTEKQHSYSDFVEVTSFTHSDVIGGRLYYFNQNQSSHDSIR